MPDSYQLIDNHQAKRFELVLEGKRPFVEYILTKDKIYLTHTEVAPELSGQGLGTALIGAVLAEVELRELTLVPLCPFVALYLKRHPEWKKLVLKGINIE